MKYITSKQMAKVDNIAMKKYGLTVEQMMENAGRNLARFAYDKFKPKEVLVAYGKGNNGGGGLVAARHLKILGVNVEIIGASKTVNTNVSRELKILKKMGVHQTTRVTKADIIIDALLGYNIKGNPKNKYAKLIKEINKTKSKIISLDLPSGLDPNTGKCHKPCIKSDYTITLALPKIGLKHTTQAGKIYLSNIGIPNEVYTSLNIKIKNYFSKDDIVKV